jgi:hypothetical protein
LLLRSCRLPPWRLTSRGRPGQAGL